ncbi:bluetail domain-containing putative surface protein [Dorea longicatena]|uniref:bluetail domain-containing putative surface protein n=1 Tax=Dorea longicatena TaxID=88431 RepID=UPI003A7F47FA
MQIPGHIFHAEIRQHHLHILFHFKKSHFISFNSGSAGFSSSTDCSNMCIAAIGVLI